MKIYSTIEPPPGTFITDRTKNTWVIDTAGNAWRIAGYPNTVYTPEFSDDFERNHGPFTIEPERHP